MPKNKYLEHIGFTSNRKFGVEIELNAFDKKLRPEPGNKVAGIDHVCQLLQKTTEEGAEVHDYEHTNNNRRWIVKPDSSCGMEVCSPPLTGWKGLEKICRVISKIAEDPLIESDSKCSVHLHVDVANLDDTKVAEIALNYIKCEPIIFDAMPDQRKKNRYCQAIGMTNLFEHDEKFSPASIISRLGDIKYYSINTKAVKSRGDRQTMEWRLIEGAGCQDAYLIKNWVRFVLHFMEMSMMHGAYKEYRKDDPTTGMCWLDPEDALKFLGFSNNPHHFHLSEGLKQVRNWFLARVMKYIPKEEKGNPRSIAWKEFQGIIERFKVQDGVEISEYHLKPPNNSWNNEVFGSGLWL